MPLKRNFKKKARRQPLRKYKRRSGGVTASVVRKIVKSVTARKAETKILRGFAYDLEVGQINGDFSGYLTKDLTANMLMSTGTSNTNRIGNEIAFTSCHLNIQITEQSSGSAAAAQFKFMIVHDKCPSGNSYVTGDIDNPAEDMYLINPFIRSAGGFDTVVKDYSSQRNLDFMGKRFTVMATKYISMRPDQLQNTENRNRTFTMGLKLKKPTIMKYNGNLTSNYIYDSGGSYFLLVFCSAGNIGPLPTIQGGIPRSVAQSGYNIAYNAQNYFKDY